MKQEAFVIEQTYRASVAKVWEALTDKEQMKQWYFDLAEFKPEVGFEFSFTAENEGITYVHLCKITEVIFNKKLSHTWRYADYEGSSLLTWELFDEGATARVKLTHEGLDTFPQDKKDFSRESFSAGWNYILGTSLKKFLEEES